MAQGEFTKQEARQTIETTEDMFKGLPKSKQLGYLGHLNDILLFLGAAERNAPDKPE